MTNKKSKENFNGVMIDEDLFGQAFDVTIEAQKAARTFVEIMNNANKALTNEVKSPLENDLKKVKKAAVLKEMEKLLPELLNKGLYFFTNSVANGLKLLGKPVVEETPDNKKIMEPKEDPLITHKRLADLHYNGSKIVPPDERPGYEIRLDCINFLFQSLKKIMRDNRTTADKALGQLECKVSDYETYIRDNPVANAMKHLSEIDDLFNAIIATLVDDVWLLGETSDGDLTIKPFSKGIEGIEEWKRPQEHPVLTAFTTGQSCLIDKLAHLR
jgi:hypothetical protein